MTAITPQQMRELADEFATEVAAVRAHNESLGLNLSGGYVSVSLDKMTEHSAALRTAADQLEAVQAWAYEHGGHFPEISELDAILTADTTPHEYNNSCRCTACLRYERSAFEVERLQTIIEDAPHAYGCEALHLGVRWPERCTCWKADAL